jgi:hypothetical protein
MNTITRRLGSTALAVLMIGSATATTTASAKDGDGRVIVRGDCSTRSDWKLKAKPDDDRMEVEFEVDSNRIGQRWTWTLRSGGSVFASGARTTQAPSGSFTVERRTSDVAGSQRISATARNARTGEVCRATLTI